MPSYPKHPQSFLQLLISCFKFYPAGFVTALPFSLVAALLGTAYVYVVRFEQGTWVTLMAFAVIALAQLYFFACGLKRMDARLVHEKIKLKALCLDTAKNLGLIYAGFFLSIIILCAVFSVGFLVVKLVSILVPGNSQLTMMVMLVFIGMPLLYLSVWLSLFVPQLVIYQEPLSTTLVKSFKKIGFKNWPATFYFYLLILFLIYFSAPGSMHMAWLEGRYLALPFFVIVYALWWPLMLNYSLLLLNRIRPR